MTRDEFISGTFAILTAMGIPLIGGAVRPVGLHSGLRMEPLQWSHQFDMWMMNFVGQIRGKDWVTPIGMSPEALDKFKSSPQFRASIFQSVNAMFDRRLDAEGAMVYG